MAGFVKETGTASPTSGGAAVTLNATTPETTECLMQAFVDLVNLANGDAIEVTIQEKVTGAGDTAQVVWLARLSHAQAQKMLASPSLYLVYGWDVKIKQTAGTSRTFKWSIRKVT